MKFTNTIKTISLILLVIFLSVFSFLQRQVIEDLDNLNSLIKDEAQIEKDRADKLAEYTLEAKAQSVKLEHELEELKKELELCKQK